MGLRRMRQKDNLSQEITQIGMGGGGPMQLLLTHMHACSGETCTRAQCDPDMFRREAADFGTKRYVTKCPPTSSSSSSSPTIPIPDMRRIIYRLEEITIHPSNQSLGSEVRAKGILLYLCRERGGEFFKN